VNSVSERDKPNVQLFVGAASNEGRPELTRRARNRRLRRPRRLRGGRCGRTTRDTQARGKPPLRPPRPVRQDRGPDRRNRPGRDPPAGDDRKARCPPVDAPALPGDLGHPGFLPEREAGSHRRNRRSM